MAYDCNPASLEGLERARDRFTDALKAPATNRGYRFDVSAFTRWCDGMKLTALPASCSTLTLYVTYRLTVAGRKVATVKRNAAAIAAGHKAAGLPSPFGDTARNVLRGARRLTPQVVRKVKALTIDNVRAISAALAKEDTALAARDRSIILTGLASALRSANIAALLLEDVAFCPEGVRLTIRRSKTDQECVGTVVGIVHGKRKETCPVIALSDWLARRGAFPGPVFTRFDHKAKELPIQPERICQIVQKAIEGVGLPWQEFGSHSLRASYVTLARLAGVPDWQIQQQTGHKGIAMLREYTRPEDVWEANGGGKIDL